MGTPVQRTALPIPMKTERGMREQAATGRRKQGQTSGSFNSNLQSKELNEQKLSD